MAGSRILERSQHDNRWSSYHGPYFSHPRTCVSQRSKVRALAFAEFPGPFLHRAIYLVRGVHSYGGLIGTDMEPG